MRKLLLLCFLTTFIIACSSQDDPVTEEEQNTEEPVLNTVLRPSKISKGDKHWIYTYDENRVTEIEEYNDQNLFPRNTIKFHYDTNNNITSIEQIYDSGEVIPMDFTFTNGLAVEYNEIPYYWLPERINEYLFIYNDQNKLTSVEYSGWFTPFPTQVPPTYGENTKLYTYNSDGNLFKYETLTQDGTIIFNLSYSYDDKNHPFKNIEIRCRNFLKLPILNHDDDEIFSGLFEDKVQFSNNNVVEISRPNDVFDISYTIIYNEQDYPIEIQPESGWIPGIIYIEYEEFPE